MVFSLSDFWLINPAFVSKKINNSCFKDQCVTFIPTHPPTHTHTTYDHLFPLHNFCLLKTLQHQP